MTFVITESCIKCKYTDCVEVCPVDCFYEGPNFLAIHPDECIDCALCVPECPVDAILGKGSSIRLTIVTADTDILDPLPSFFRHKNQRLYFIFFIS